MDFSNLSPELQEKAKACTTADELRALAESEGLELGEELLDAVSGGRIICPSRSTYENWPPDDIVVDD